MHQTSSHVKVEPGYFQRTIPQGHGARNGQRSSIYGADFGTCSRITCKPLRSVDLSGSSPYKEPHLAPTISITFGTLPCSL